MQPEHVTQDKVEDFTGESSDITLARVMTTVLMLTSFLRRKDEPKDAFEKIKGTEILQF